MSVVGGTVRTVGRTVSGAATATTAAAGAVGGAAVSGIVGGVTGAAKGIQKGLSSGSKSTAAAALAIGAIRCRWTRRLADPVGRGRRSVAIAEAQPHPRGGRTAGEGETCAGARQAGCRKGSASQSVQDNSQEDERSPSGHR